MPSDNRVGQRIDRCLAQQAGDLLNAPITSFVDFTDPDVKDRMLAEGPLFDLVSRDKVAGLLESDIRLNSDSKFLFYLVSAKLFLEAQEAFAP